MKRVKKVAQSRLFDKAFWKRVLRKVWLVEIGKTATATATTATKPTLGQLYERTTTTRLRNCSWEPELTKKPHREGFFLKSKTPPLFGAFTQVMFWCGFWFLLQTRPFCSKNFSCLAQKDDPQACAWVSNIWWADCVAPLAFPTDADLYIYDSWLVNHFPRLHDLLPFLVNDHMIILQSNVKSLLEPWHTAG